MRNIIGRTSIALLGVAIISLSHCSKESKEIQQKPVTLDEDRQVTVRRSLALLESANPDSDAAKSIERDEISFIGLMGYSLEVPGVSGIDGRFRDSVPIRVIEGTTDAVETDEERELNDVGRRYAERFNALILKYLKERDTNHHPASAKLR